MPCHHISWSLSLAVPVSVVDQTGVTCWEHMAETSQIGTQGRPISRPQKRVVYTVHYYVEGAWEVPGRYAHSITRHRT